ncbi:MAG TPA: PhoPQ-activated protein PqaA family protein [Steroidobacteraceae bacterium]|nr:PhoPQ-activated protein PqaA family protein [Steroidobacteraceae bacterium]
MLAACLLAAGLTPRAHADGELAQYLAKPDASYSWHEIGSGRLGGADYVQAILTSQTWRDIPWKHQLIVFRPAKVDASRQALLFIDGGRWKPEYESLQQADLPREAQIFTRLADSIHAPVAVVREVPFQPLFERREDALIAYTFDSYLKTGEPDWPLLLPMVKSAARAMDAVQEIARERWQIPIERFTISGASKRGWTSWLTAACDPRVASVAPMVIDMLNMPEQIKLQRATFGELSEQIRDYSDINLPGRIDSDLGRNLLAMVDPYSYRASLAQPKLILLGTNDRYWPLDALKVYWNDLSEPKRVLYMPNQGHGLRDVDRLIGSLSALFRYSARGEALPELSWSWQTPDAKSLQLSVQADRKPRELIAWTASSATRDFRTARWSQGRCKRSANGYTCNAALSHDRYSALYSEATFKDRDAPAFSISTAICIAGGPEVAPANCLSFETPQRSASGINPTNIAAR